MRTPTTQVEDPDAKLDRQDFTEFEALEAVGATTRLSDEEMRRHVARLIDRTRRASDLD